MNTIFNRLMFWRSSQRSFVGRSFTAFAQTGLLVCLFASALANAQDPNRIPPPPDQKPANVHLLTGEQHADLLKDAAAQKEIDTRKQAEAFKEKEPFALEYNEILTEACKAAYADADIAEVGECQADLTLKDKAGKQVGGIWPKLKPEPKPPVPPPTSPAAPAPAPASAAKQ